MRPCISNGCFKSFWVWYARRVPGMWPWKGFSLSVDENSINASNKKHGKVLTIFHNKDFSPESSNELIASEDIVLTKTLFLSSCSPTFLPSLFSFPLSVLDWDFLCVVKNLVRVSGPSTPFSFTLKLEKFLRLYSSIILFNWWMSWGIPNKFGFYSILEFKSKSITCGIYQKF